MDIEIYGRQGRASTIARERPFSRLGCEDLMRHPRFLALAEAAPASNQGPLSSSSDPGASPGGSPSAAPAQAPSCYTGPRDFSSSSLALLGEQCGESTASKYLYEATGYDTNQDRDPQTGKIVWQKSALHLASMVTGEDLSHILNPDGSINPRGIAQTVGSVAAAAVCTAFGAGAAASVCGLVGGVIGGALYDLGKDLVSLFSGPDKFYPVTPSSDQDVAAVEIYYAGVQPARAANVLAYRAFALLLADLVSKARADWNRHTGDSLSWADMYSVLLAHGLQPPPGWAGSLATPAGPLFAVTETSAGIYDPVMGGPNGTPQVFIPEWSIAYGVFGHPQEKSKYDDPAFLAQLPPGLRPSYSASALFGINQVADSSGAIVTPPYVNFAADPRDPGGECPAFPNQTYNANPCTLSILATLNMPASQITSPDAGTALATVHVLYDPAAAPFVSITDPVAQTALRANWLGSVAPALKATGLAMRSRVQDKQGSGAVTTVLTLGAVGGLAYLGYRALHAAPRRAAPHAPHALRRR